jgi:hypothetical protein
MTRAVWIRTNVLPVFVVLQCLDVLTTLIFLSKGVAEGNPLLSWTLSYAHAPWMGLIAAKLMATFIGYYCYRKGRITALRLANVGYFLIVGWNLITIAASAITR